MSGTTFSPVQPAPLTAARARTAAALLLRPDQPRQALQHSCARPVCWLQVQTRCVMHGVSRSAVRSATSPHTSAYHADVERYRKKVADSPAGGTATVQTSVPDLDGTQAVPDTVSALESVTFPLALPSTGCRTTTPPCRLAHLQDEFVMVETTGEDGSEMQIIYRNGGDVRASCVEQLCDKVRYLCVMRIVSLSCRNAAGLPCLNGGPRAIMLLFQGRLATTAGRKDGGSPAEQLHGVHTDTAASRRQLSRRRRVDR